MRKLFFILLPILLILSGCAHRIQRKALMRISLGMEKEQVIKSIGKPTICRGCITTKQDQILEVWEYTVDKGKTSAQVISATIATVFTLGLYTPLLFLDGELETYLLYFHDEKLVQWGKAGDWEKEANSITEIRFKNGQVSI